jgi:hypothetical protein
MSNSVDTSNLKILSFFQYIVAILFFCAGFVPFLYLIFGTLFVVAGASQGADTEGGGLIAAGGIIIMALGILAGGGCWLMGFLYFLTGRWLKRGKHYLFCMIMAVIECCFMPFGTILGILTIFLLLNHKEYFLDR